MSSSTRKGIYSRSRRSEFGNVFFTLFGAVAVVGVLGAGIMATMRGPLSTMVEVNRREQAKAELRVASSLVLVNSGDTCADTDSYTEGPDPAGAGPTGGGLLPAVGAAQNDPWGNAYGYCAWDHGDVPANHDGCGTNILAGNTSTNNIAIAVLSAGPDGTFQTSCVADNAGVNDYVEPDGGGGDDIVVTMTYTQAISGSGGLWTDVSPSEASIGRDLTVTGTGTSDFTGNLNIQGTGAFQDVLAANASIQLPDDNILGGGACGPANSDGLLRVNDGNLNDQVPVLEVCDESASNWVPAGSPWRLTGSDLYYTAGNVGIGTGMTNPNNTLDIVGTAEITQTLDLGGNFNVNSGQFTVNAADGNTVVGGTLDVQDNTIITGSTDDGSTNPLTIEDSGSSPVFTVDSDGNADAAGNINTDGFYQIDGAQFLSGDSTIPGTVLLGTTAGASVTGDNNIVVGGSTAATLTTGTDNIIIGSGLDVPTATGAATSNYLNIGDAIIADLSSGEVGIGFPSDTDVSSFDDALEVNGDADINGILNVTGTAGAGDAITLGDNVIITGDTDDGSTSPLIIEDSGNNTLFEIDSDGFITSGIDASDVYIDGTKNLDPGGACGATEFSKWTGSGWTCVADGTGGGGGDGVGTEGLTEVLANNNDANNTKIVNMADPTLDQDAATKKYVDDQLGALNSDRIQDTQNDTFIDVDTSDDGATNSIVFTTAGGAGSTVTLVTDANDDPQFSSSTNMIGINDDLNIQDGNYFRLYDSGNDRNGFLGMTNDAELYIGTTAGDIALMPNEGVSIGATSAADTALLDISSTTKGFLAPRMLESERDLIGSPATGLLIFNTDAGDNGLFQFYDGFDWVDVGAGGAEGGGLWTPDGTNDYIEYDDSLGGVRIGRISGQPAPETDWTLDVGNSVVYTSTNTVAIGSSSVSNAGGANLNVVLDLTGDIAATEYCDADGANCFTAASVAGGGSNVALSNITAASADNTIDNGNWNQVWRWHLAGAETAFTFTESTAATGGSNNQAILGAQTLSGSTAIPLAVENAGNSLSFYVADEAVSTETTPFVIDADGRVGVGILTPTEPIDVLGRGVMVGGDHNVWTARTDTTAKSGAWLMPHYTNAEEPVVGLFTYNSNGTNRLSFGGGTANYNAATDLRFYTGGTITTTTGSLRMQVDSSGNVGIGDYDVDTIESQLHVQTGDIRMDGGAGDEAGCFRFDDTTTNTLQYSNDCMAFTSFDDIAGTPGGNDTEVQYNDNGDFAGDAGMTYNDATDTLTLGTALHAGEYIRITGQSGNAPTFATLGQLDDVNVAGVSDGDLLYYNNASGDWEPYDPSALSGLWTDLTGGRIHYGTTAANQVGVGTNNPNITLDVAGGLKISDAAEACDAAHEGAIKFVSGSNSFFFCADEGDDWQAISLGSGVTEIDDLTDASSDGATFSLTLGTGTGDASSIGNYNTHLGFYAGGSHGAGAEYNTAIGGNALVNGDDDDNNTAIGYNSMGTIGIAAGTNNNNTAVGYYSLGAPEGTSNSTAIGYNALIGLISSTGTNNTALGASAGAGYTSGSNNLFLGYQAGDATTTGSDNILIGYDVDASAATASNELNIGNAIRGNMAGLELFFDAPSAVPLDGSFNNSEWSLWLDEDDDQFKLKAKKSNGSVITQTVGTPAPGAININDLGDAATDYVTLNNMFLGSGVGGATTSGNGNTAIGDNAYQADTTGRYNTAIGNNAMAAIDGDGVADQGSYNTAIGHNALAQTTVSSSNTAIGHSTLDGGGNAGDIGNNNVAVGANVLRANEGSNNVAIGQDSMHDNTTGANNTALGTSALNNKIAGNNNIAIGYQSGDNLTAGDNNIIIGAGIDAPSASGSYQLNIADAIRGNMAGLELFFDAPSIMPLDGSFQNSEWALWLDESNDEFELKARKSDGSYISQTVGGGSGLWTDATNTINYGNFYLWKTGTTMTGLSGSGLYYDVDNASLYIGDDTNDKWIEADLSTNSVIAGTDLSADVDSSIVIGSFNNVESVNGTGSFIGGYSNTYDNNAGSMIVQGNNNQISYAGNGILVGENSEVYGNQNYVFGQEVIANYSTRTAIFSLGDHSSKPSINSDADDSFVVLLGDQGGTTFNTAERFAVLGGEMLLDDDGSAGSQGCLRYVQGTGLQYSNDCSSYSNFGSAAPGGADTHVQYNSGGSLAGEAAFTYDDSNNILTVATLSATDRVSLTPKTSIGTPNGLALGDISDVDVTGASDGEVLTYNNSTGNWEPAASSGGGLWTDETTHIAYDGTGGARLGDTGDTYFHIDANTGGGNEAGIFLVEQATDHANGNGAKLWYDGDDNRFYIAAEQDVEDSLGVGDSTDIKFTIDRDNDYVGIHNAEPDRALDVIGTLELDNDATGTGGCIRFDGAALEFSNDCSSSWTDLGGGATLTSADTQVHFNSSGSEAGDAGLTYIAGSDTLNIGTAINVGSIVNIGATAGAAAPTGAVASGGATPAGSDTEIQFNDNGSFGASSDLTWDGSVLSVAGATGDIEYTGTITDVSDMRLKDNIEPLNKHGALLDKIKGIDTYSFTMKDDTEGRTEYGVMAQELEKIFPELVHTANNEMGTKSVNYVGLIAPMIEATKELKAENDALKAELSELRETQQAMMEEVNGLKVHTGYGISKAEIGLFMLLGVGGTAVLFMLGSGALLHRQRQPRSKTKTIR